MHAELLSYHNNSHLLYICQDTMNNQLTEDEYYMHRCIELARLGAGNVAPNPMVGAVLVHGGRIIGEGYHMQYGQGTCGGQLH